MTNDSDPIAAVKRFYDAMANPDLTAGYAMLPQNTRWTYHGSPATIPFAGTVESPAGVKDFFERYAAAVEPIEFSPHSFAHDGNLVFVRGIEHSRVRATGKEYRVEWLHAIAMENGRIATFEEFLDTSTVAAAFVG